MPNVEVSPQSELLALINGEWRTEQRAGTVSPPAGLSYALKYIEKESIMGEVHKITEVNSKQSASDQAREVLDFLNKKTSRNYRPVNVNLEFILARFREGYTVQDLKSVTALMCRKWLTDEKMSEYLRPKTLYSSTNFSQYVGLVPNTDGEPE